MGYWDFFGEKGRGCLSGHRGMTMGEAVLPQTPLIK